MLPLIIDMRKLIFIVALFSSLAAMAQTRKDVAILAASHELHMAVFRDKDSSTVADMFADQLTYGHSSAKIENREEAIQGIIHNKSTYKTVMMGAILVCITGNTAVSRYNYETDEVKPDGTISHLKLHILLVWAKEKKKWKLLARQAVKIN
jgi:ketosteroid isomerase-like protein